MLGSDAVVRPVVFIVDDDAAVRESVAMLVRSVGLETRAFASGNEFLDDFSPDRQGCVLLDLRMPGLNGLEVHDRLLAMDAAIPVIFLTAQGAAEIPSRCAGITRIQKPFRDQELVEHLRRLMPAQSR